MAATTSGGIGAFCSAATPLTSATRYHQRGCRSASQHAIIATVTNSVAPMSSSADCVLSPNVFAPASKATAAGIAHGVVGLSTPTRIPVATSSTMAHRYDGRRSANSRSSVCCMSHAVAQYCSGGFLKVGRFSE